MKKETIILLASLIGFKIQEDQAAMSETDFAEAFDLESFEAELQVKAPQLSTNLASLGSLTTEKETAEAEVQRLTAENATLTSATTDSSEMRADNEAEVQRLYEASTGKPASEALLASFKKADYAALKSFRELYATKLEEDFPGKCAKCGSGEIVRNSTNPDEQEDDKGGAASLSARAIKNSFLNGEITIDPNRNY